ncbi:MAG: DUF3099 domain-containing protein [Micromonosporaceae bacterium]
MSRRHPVVITDAETSPDDQLRSRQIRYATMMGLRLVCLIVAGVLVSAQAPLLWLWLPLCIVGMVALPWMAVLIANDRPPKRRHQLSAMLRGRGKRSGESASAPGLTPDQRPDRRALSMTEQRIIDVDQ